MPLKVLFFCSASNVMSTTVNVSRISHRKWRESKQQLIRLLDLTLLGCILVSFHILSVIQLTFTVEDFKKIASV